MSPQHSIINVQEICAMTQYSMLRRKDSLTPACLRDAVAKKGSKDNEAQRIRIDTDDNIFTIVSCQK